MIRPFLTISLALLFSGPALSQSSFSGNNQPRVITGQADLAFWTELVTGGICTPERLSSALLTDRGRSACDTTDSGCYERAGTAVVIACVSGEQITASCIASYGSPGTPAFEDCLAGVLNVETRPLHGLSSETGTAGPFQSTSVALIKDGLPDPIEVTGRTSMTFPERRRILDAVKQAQTVTPLDCAARSNVADIDECNALAGFRYVEEVARYASLAHGLNR